MGSPLGNYRDVPDGHHVARYCRPKHVKDGQIKPQAFQLRKDKDKDEKYLSVNWMEYFKTNDVFRQMKCVRKAMLMNFQLQPKGRFARLSVARIKNSIDNLQVKNIPSRKNPSHAGIYIDKDENGSIALELANSIQPGDVFPGLDD